MLFDLPFRGEDLDPGVRIYNRKEVHTEDPSHEQHHGFDLTALRYDAGRDRWTDDVAGTDGDKNTERVVYGIPVHAAADGRVVRGWRNAPENPRPKRSGDTEAGQEWLHPERRAGNIAAGGNFLQMDLDDGSHIRYSHFVPGSIPPALCPHTAALLPNGRISDTDIDPADQATVRAGQFLGLVGNAGNSTGPHLHFHRWKDGTPQPMDFRRGLATPVTDGDQADIDSWTRFAGSPIPAGPVLVWPPRTVGREYARHGFPSHQYGRMFDHLADSGYWPRWFDGYTVGDDRFLNFVWTKAPGRWMSYSGQTGTEHDRRMADAKEAGFAPVLVFSSHGAGGVRYGAVFEKGRPGRWRARHGLTPAEHEAELDRAEADGLSPVCVSVVSLRGARSYTVLYRSDPVGSWVVRSSVKEPEYQGLVDTQARAGRAPIYLKAYMHDGDPCLSTIFASAGGDVRARHGLSSARYQQEYDDATGAGLSTRVVTAFDGAKTQHRYAAVWR